MQRAPAPAEPTPRRRFNFKRPRFEFTRFQSRLLALMLGLIIVLQALLFYLISSTAHNQAQQASRETLELTASSLQTIVRSREANLRKYARLLADDYAFKTLVAEGDRETVLSAFSSYQKRLDADWMVLLDLDGQVLADSMDGEQAPPQKPLFQHPALLQAARSHASGESSGALIIKGRVYQVVLAPLRAPEQIAWVGIGFVITDQLAAELEKQTHTHVSLFWQGAPTAPATAPGAPQMLASTLPAAQRQALLAQSKRNTLTQARMLLQEAEFVSLTLSLNRGGDGVLLALLQRSLDEALADYRALRWQLLGIFIISSLLAALLAVLIARRVTQPVARLARAAQDISAGHYRSVEELNQRDEFGALAHAFNNMVHGLQERDKVRSLLGKVVSPQVAEELLSRRIELGGEEREMTLLFSDIRNFTSLAEGLAPSAILQMLNQYLSEMSQQIDQQQGVVDKYIGDAVMALFGAPVALQQHAQAAVQCALAMQAALPELNRNFAAAGWPQLHVGIGVHSGNVVAGNVGSESRMNYTVLGDNVNLAARLEGLCKKYAVGVIVSEATAQACPDICLRELDKVRVKGKSQAVRIYQALGLRSQTSADALAALQAYHAALQLYRAAEFDAAFAAFCALEDDAVTELYRARCARFLKDPPQEDWDAVETLDQK
ncbi:adenylate/guanylate cyclase domain-containing protein [Massilia sp. W12]|uniref:adenylate/guanylate cyclase domain-containing protein n=1 Tax=Massilia sp. W12 TaxID=3126507 RepID=UPI0030CF23F3